MKKTLLVILPIILLISAAFFVWKARDQVDSNLKYINGILYYLDIEMDILAHTKKHYIDDKYLEDKLTHLIANKLLVLSQINPAIDRLEGTPLNALNRLVAYNKSNPLDFKLGDSEFISQAIEKYLNRIESNITIETKRREKIFKDPLKKEVKERWGISKETD